MEKNSSMGMSSEEIIDGYIRNLTQLSDGFVGAMEIQDYVIAYMYRESFYESVKDLSTVTLDGKNALDCVKDELANRGLVYEALLPEDPIFREEMGV